MKYCAACGGNVEGMKFCPNCGHGNPENELPQPTSQEQIIEGKKLLSAKKKLPIFMVVLIVGLVLAVGITGIFFLKPGRGKTLEGLAEHEINILEIPFEEEELEKYFAEHNIYRLKFSDTHDWWNCRVRDTERFTLFEKPLFRVNTYSDQTQDGMYEYIYLSIKNDEGEVFEEQLISALDTSLGKHITMSSSIMDTMAWLYNDRVIQLYPSAIGDINGIIIDKYERFNEKYPEELQKLKKLNE